MNHHVTLEQVSARLTENKLAHRVIDAGGGTPIVVCERGGRVLGPFAGANRESVLWINKPFGDKEEFRKFLASGDWNLGGDRVWIAPEHRFNMKDRLNLFNTYALPAEVDPGRYGLRDAPSGCSLEEEASLPVYGPEAKPKRLRIQRYIAPAADPLREMSGYRELSSRVAYCGYLHEVRLSEIENDGVNAELWDIAQANPGGHAYVAVHEGGTHTEFYEPAGADHHRVFGHYTRIKIDGERMFKVGYKAPQFLGRVAYHNKLGDSEYLFVRAVFSNPSARYTMEPATVPGDTGYPIQVFNDNGMFGGFGEIEVSGQAIGGHTGRSTSADQVLNWFYVGAREALASIARILVGADLE